VSVRLWQPSEIEPSAFHSGYPKIRSRALAHGADASFGQVTLTLTGQRSGSVPTAPPRALIPASRDSCSESVELVVACAVHPAGVLAHAGMTSRRFGRAGFNRSRDRRTCSCARVLFSYTQTLNQSVTALFVAFPPRCSHRRTDAGRSEQ
jgi:hypothetical protein